VGIGVYKDGAAALDRMERQEIRGENVEERFYRP
jgi:hypothetical protein